MVDMLSSSLKNFVSLDPNTSWAAKSWDPAFSLMRDRARFQQKQLQEKEEKLLRLYEEQQERQERALQRVKGPWNPPASTAPAVPSGIPTSNGQAVGVGKVRSLLQYRRDHGRDKSCPLEPIPTYHKNLPKQNRTQSLEPRKQPLPKQKVLYFGGSHQDLRFSDELDYGQSFQVIDDQLLYEDGPKYRNDSDESDDFYVKSFNNKRQFYENHFAGVSEENLTDLYQQKTFQKLPNVGVKSSLRMSQKVEAPATGGYKPYVSGKSTIGATPPRSGLPTRQNSTSSAAKKPSALPAGRPRDSTAARFSPESQISALRNLRVSSPTNGISNGGVERKMNGSSTPPPRLNGGSATSRPLNGSISGKSQSPVPRTPEQMVPPVPASRTTAPRPQSTSSAASSSPRKAAVAAGLVPCRLCGRNFAQDRVERHQSICKKTSVKKRKTYDPVKHRVQGTEAAQYVLTGVTARNAKQAEAKVQATKSNWRKKHEEFINSIRAAKEVQEHLKKGGKLADLPPPPPSDYSDYVQCPHCQRKFNTSAAERHIPKCASMRHNKPNPGAAAAAKRPAAPVRSTSTFRKK